jgi:hypothetical protein
VDIPSSSAPCAPAPLAPPPYPSSTARLRPRPARVSAPRPARDAGAGERGASDLYKKGERCASDLYEEGERCASGLYQAGERCASGLYDEGERGGSALEAEVQVEEPEEARGGRVVKVHDLRDAGPSRRKQQRMDR